MTTWDAFDLRLIAKRRGILEGFLEFLRHNTVSQNPEGVRAGGEWLAALMRRRGLEARVLETGGGPAVFGERRTPGARRTVLVYCHYDTKPAPAKEWFQPSPFEPVFRKVGDADDAAFVSFDRVPTEALTDWRVYARGASDDKGPIWSHLEALALMDELGLPPKVNLKFIFDGEEEIGSPFFGPLTEKHKDLLKADLVLVTDGPKHGSGRPTISFGARGVLKFELTIESARRDLHSGNFAAPNPNWQLAALLSSMAAPDGTPLMEGFEDGVAPPTQAE
ncbi:MAG TPA: M20/M25/M40 family metallo-hydrolase, partial [Methylomirabilota bacterium]|nr:M20/M25/M40 family metallo-hydrolase [Methylomirabilota bacterium]